MAKKKETTYADYTHVTPGLIDLVQKVIAESDKHRYSVSSVYAAYNGTHGLSETPQSCSSCLILRVNLLRKWLKDYNDNNKKNKTTIVADPQPAQRLSAKEQSAENGSDA